MLSALVFFLAGGMEAMVMRAQLAAPNLKLITPETYNQVFTMHGTTMIFLVAMPVLTGFGVYLVPLMIGANETALPRLGALSFWLQFFGGILLYFSFATGDAPDAGWFSYAPLSEKAFSPGPGLDYWALALLMIAGSTVGSAINLIVTVATERAPGMTMRLVPLFVWMTLITSVMIVFALPALAASLVMLLSDRLLHARFFDPAQGGAPLLWQHYFWIFGHPEVYIVVLPAFGMISEIIPVFSRKPIFGYPFMATSTVAIAFLSYGVWVHHMFAVALGRNFLAVFAAASMLIAVPTGMKIFSWIATMWGGAIRFTTAMLFAVAFLLEFTVGGLSGVAFATVPVDWQLTDTYFVVAHIHYVLFGGTVFALLAGIHYWFPKIQRANDGREARPLELLADRAGLQHGVFRPTFPGTAGDDAPRLHLSGSSLVRRAEPDFDRWRGHPRLRHSPVLRNVGNESAISEPKRATIPGTPGRSNGPRRRRRCFRISRNFLKCAAAGRCGI